VSGDSVLRKLEKKLRLPGLAQHLAAAVAASADPRRAGDLAPVVLDAAAKSGGLAAIWRQQPDLVCRIVAQLTGAAPFLAPFLERHPDWLARLATDDLRAERTCGDYARRLEELGSSGAEANPGDVLRAFKYYELARITLRDLCFDLVPEAETGHILAELSHLADATLDRAWHLSLEKTAARAAVPTRRDRRGGDVALRFCVLGLGKLGGEELNYSSDVDLVYVYETPPGESEEVAGDAASAAEFFSKAAREFGRLVGKATEQGFLYRIDLDLRPEGRSGSLVVPDSALATYYDAWAATWEKAAFMKARPVAGDLDFGWRVIRAIDPMIYRSSMDLAGVEAIREMKRRIEDAKGRVGETFNVKLGAGGIRDIEFICQALQLMHGGRMPQVRDRSTQSGLTSLAEVGALPAEECASLLAAYRFLRRVENRLQMEGEGQVYHLPDSAEGMTRLARAMSAEGDDDPDASFATRLAKHRERVEKIFTRLFQQGAGDQIVDLFARNVPFLLANPTTRGLAEGLAAHFARSVEHSSSPERAMNNLDRFLRGVGKRKFFYELLLDRPELVPRLTALFAGSEHLSEYVATHPRLIEPLFDDPNLLLLSRQQLSESYRSVHAFLKDEGRRDEPELSLDALRLFHNRELVNVGLLDMDDKIGRAAAEGSLSEIAEICIEEGLELARREERRRASKRLDWLDKGEFLVVGMGKLASREMTYGSDLDVIFLYELRGANEEALLRAQSGFVGLAQKFIWALQTRTPEGVCYLIDARLRPSGNQGLLVSHLSSFAEYHEKTAQNWEHQALLRARPVSGDARLAKAFEKLRRKILLQAPPPDLGGELHRVRLRMESELARETLQRRDFKTGRGGLLDVESAVQFLQLRHALEHPELIEVRTIAEQLDQLEKLALIDAAHARVLRDGWEFLQRLSSRLRIVENRSISDLDEERGDLGELARRLGYAAGGRDSSARRALLEDYQRHSAAIRETYLRVLGIAEDAGAPTDAEPTVKSGPRRRTAADALRRRGRR